MISFFVTYSYLFTCLCLAQLCLVQLVVVVVCGIPNREVTECFLVEKLCNVNIHNIVEEYFSHLLFKIFFSNFHTAGIKNANLGLADID